eukprot:Clim_evm33s243 gene=Clim_evmTU33s243
MNSEHKQLKGLTAADAYKLWKEIDPAQCKLERLNGRYKAGIWTLPGLSHQTTVSVMNVVMDWAGLKGWWGKQFTGDGRGINICYPDADKIFQRTKSLEKRCPMHIVVQPSLVDGKPCVCVQYRKEDGAFAPWTGVYDELRPLDDDTWIGMAALNFGGSTFAWATANPFLLEKVGPAE